jgi:Mn-dependent DtxR family transcriptional regulator
MLMNRHTKRLEFIVRGFSNHRRIEILNFLEARPNLDLLQISRELRVNFKTCSEHTRRLAVAGLVYKQPKGQSVLHTISPRGKKVLVFLRTLE